MKISKEIDLEIKKLLESGIRINKIAERTGLCKETIRRKSRMLGIKTFKGKSNAYTLNSLPEDLKQLILASILGDGSFVKVGSTGYCMTILHAEKQMQYILFKSSILEKYNLTSGVTKIKFFDKRYNHSFIEYRLRSRNNPVFKEIRNRFYKDGGKFINDTTIFEDLSPLGLAIWYMDDGYITTSSCIFSTVSIPFNTQEKLADILLRKFDLHFTVGHNDNSMYLCASDFSKFKEIISPYITNDLKYKLVPYRHRVLDKSEELLESCDANQQPSLGSA